MNQKFLELVYQAFGKEHEVLWFDDGCLERFYELASQEAYADGYHAGVRMKDLLKGDINEETT